LLARRYIDGGAVCVGARLRDESVANRHGATEQIVRAPSNADAKNAEDAGEFPGTPT
jgi:hypothetical protein